MAFSRIFSSLSNRLSEGPFTTDEPNLPSGGHSGYRPEDYRTQSRRARAQQSSAQQTASAQPLGYSSGFATPRTTAGYGTNGYQGTMPQPVVGAEATGQQAAQLPGYGVVGYSATAPQQAVGYGGAGYAMPAQAAGYGASQQPIGGSGNGAQQMNGYAMPQQIAGYGAPQQATGYAMPQQMAGYGAPQQATGYAMPQQMTGYAAPQQPSGQTAPQPVRRAPVSYSMKGYSGAVPQVAATAPNGYQQTFPQRDQKPYQSKFGKGQRQQARNRQDKQAGYPQIGAQMQQFPQPQTGAQANGFFADQPRQPVQQPRKENVTYMPNVYVGDDGAAYRHVERLTQPMSASTCYRLIEFMRNGESVIVNTELIQDDRENQRCLDLLYGAAYTMNCSFTRISAKSIYLIAPATVSVISYESIRQMNEQDQAVRWPGNESALLSGNRPHRAPVFGHQAQAAL